MNDRNRTRQKDAPAFSLVEVLAAVAIIGVVIFLAIPNIVRVRQDAEESLAKSRADALNVAAAAYFQAVGPQTALGNWTNASDNARYALVKPYLAFAPTNTNLSSYMPKNYHVNFNTTNPHRQKAVLSYTNTNSGVARTDIAY